MKEITRVRDSKESISGSERAEVKIDGLLFGKDGWSNFVEALISRQSKHRVKIEAREVVSVKKNHMMRV